MQANYIEVNELYKTNGDKNFKEQTCIRFKI